jgi:hypothetical protein
MSGQKHYFTCELDGSLSVRLHLDWEGDMFIAVIQDGDNEWDSVLLTKEDAAKMAEVLKAYAES